MFRRSRSNRTATRPAGESLSAFTCPFPGREEAGGRLRSKALASLDGKYAHIVAAIERMNSFMIFAWVDANTFYETAGLGTHRKIILVSL